MYFPLYQGGGIILVVSSVLQMRWALSPLFFHSTSETGIRSNIMAVQVSNTRHAAACVEQQPNRRPRHKQPQNGRRSVCMAGPWGPGTASLAHPCGNIQQQYDSSVMDYTGSVMKFKRCRTTTAYTWTTTESKPIVATCNQISTRNTELSWGYLLRLYGNKQKMEMQQWCLITNFVSQFLAPPKSVMLERLPASLHHYFFQSDFRIGDAAIHNGCVDTPTKVRKNDWHQWSGYCDALRVDPYLVNTSFCSIVCTAIGFAGRIQTGGAWHGEVVWVGSICQALGGVNAQITLNTGNQLLHQPRESNKYLVPIQHMSAGFKVFNPPLDKNWQRTLTCRNSRVKGEITVKGPHQQAKW